MVEAAARSLRCGCSSLLLTVSLVENLHHVGHPLALSESPNARAKLEHTTGIRRDDYRSCGRVYRMHLFPEQRQGHAGVNDIVDTRAPATQIRERHFLELQARNG